MPSYHKILTRSQALKRSNKPLIVGYEADFKAVFMEMSHQYASILCFILLIFLVSVLCADRQCGYDVENKAVIKQIVNRSKEQK